MGYNLLNVSSGKGNTDEGPMWYNPTVQLKKLTLGEKFLAADGWLRLGEGHTDGIESSRESTVTDKRLWGNKSGGNVFSEFKDTLTANFASAFDLDVMGVVFGSENVVVSPDEIFTIVKQRTPGFGTFVFQVKLDDGRDHWLVIPAGQPDPNATETYNDSDIVTVTTTIMCSERTITDAEASYNLTSYRLTEPLPASDAEVA